MLIENVSNILNEGIAEVNELASKNLCDVNYDLSDALRKMLINNEACDTIGSQSQDNCSLNAMKESDVARKAGNDDQMLMNWPDILNNDSR